jgi:hypothetical protein
MKSTIITVLLISIAFNSKGQDSIVAPVKPEKPHEFGISILAPLFMLSGGRDNPDRYSNLMYRYRFTEHHAMRVFAGTAMPQESYPNIYDIYYVVESPFIYPVLVRTRPSNFQVGIGYEYITAGRLKQVPSIDIVYNNVFEKEEFYYLKTYQTKDSIGNKTSHIQRVDTAGFVRTSNYDKIGINLSYSLRYDLSSRWQITGSFILSYRFSQRRTKSGTVSNHDLNMPGLLGDLSVFYKF